MFFCWFQIIFSSKRIEILPFLLGHQKCPATFMTRKTVTLGFNRPQMPGFSLLLQVSWDMICFSLACFFPQFWYKQIRHIAIEINFKYSIFYDHCGRSSLPLIRTSEHLETISSAIKIIKEASTPVTFGLLRSYPFNWNRMKITSRKNRIFYIAEICKMVAQKLKRFDPLDNALPIFYLILSSIY